MTAKALRLNSAHRHPHTADYDSLEFHGGVNVIVGELQAGKTTWLRMIDYVLGDTGKLENAFDAALAEKYERLSVVLAIEEKEFHVERRWKEAGAKSKIFVDGERLSADEFGRFMLEQLGIPSIRVPSGNPYDRTWPELSWRELLRHFYKQERTWGDFAERQPATTRSACILHFLNAASALYPKEYETLVQKKKEIDRLQAQKEVFTDVLQNLAVELIQQPNMTVAVTPESILDAKERLRVRLQEIDVGRSEALKTFDEADRVRTTPHFERAKERLADLYQKAEEIDSELAGTKRRAADLIEYHESLKAELDRLDRAKVAAAAFADLKVTHCPACDRPVPPTTIGSSRCSVCGQEQPSSAEGTSTGARRIEFEQQQLTEEAAELTELTEELKKTIDVLETRKTNVGHEIRSETRAVSAAQTLAVRALPPEVSLFDREAGEISEQLSQLERVGRALKSRDELTKNIADLDREIEALDAEVKLLAPTVDFGALGDLLADRMNDYLNLVNLDQLSRWKTGRVAVKLKRDEFNVFLDGQPWTIRAGGTAAYTVQIAYQYALLSLTKDQAYNYPGFLVMDFPPHFSKAEDLRGSENYLLKPFVDLCSKDSMRGTQVVIAGRAFDNLEGAHFIRL